jgi:hypothetical protein
MREYIDQSKVRAERKITTPWSTSQFQRGYGQVPEKERNRKNLGGL